MDKILLDTMNRLRKEITKAAAWRAFDQVQKLQRQLDALLVQFGDIC